MNEFISFTATHFRNWLLAILLLAIIIGYQAFLSYQVNVGIQKVITAQTELERDSLHVVDGVALWKLIHNDNDQELDNIYGNQETLFKTFLENQAK